MRYALMAQFIRRSIRRVPPNRINYRSVGIVAGIAMAGALAVAWSSGLLIERDGSLPAKTLIVYNALVLALVAGELYVLSRLRSRRYLASIIASLVVLLFALSFGAAFLNTVDGFGKIQLLAWAVFVHYPLFLIGVACLCFNRSRTLSCLCIVPGICLLLVGLDAFFLEPHSIEVTHISIPSPKLQKPIRIAVVADLQTDKLRRYEEHVFELVAAERPDLILLAGDYLHIWNRTEYVTAKAELNALIRRAHLEAPLGIYAVRGNVDWDDWTTLFAGLPIETFITTSSRDLGPVILTGLTLNDSSNPALSVSAQDKFHIVIGHSPNYSLGQVEADLLIAGHTHGGQVRIPLFGPVFTLSQVPGSWTSGVTLIAPGRRLIVSRGIGMERGNAPRMRFLCRPELLILDLAPSGL
jgi:predicted MPP superfamily phosphohydrolase